MVTKINPLVVIVGETASGKSKLAIKLALKFNGEIVNADSWTVYKGFDIGTAKPSLEDQALAKHHLIDIADPMDGFSAAQYKKLAIKKIDEIISRGKLPILVGGAGLYIDSVIYDYSFLPKSDHKLRRKYNDMELEKLLDDVRNLKYDTTNIDLNNKRRVIRLLENKGKRPISKELRDGVIIIGIKIDPNKLRNNIENRVDQMFALGLEGEVKQLANKYGWNNEPMKGIGYREFKRYVEGTQNLEETRQAIINSSLRLAKKQRTWFKRNKSIQWVNTSSKSVEILTTHLNNLSVK